VLIVNVVISIITSDNKLRTICMSGSIISNDGTVDEQSHAIIGAFNDSQHLLEDWHKMTTEMYPDDIGLLALIPYSSDMSPTKLIGGFLSHDNCATANKTGDNVMDMILKLGKELGMNDQDLILYQGYCFNHLQNMRFVVIENNLSWKITKVLMNDLESIPSHLQVGRLRVQLVGGLLIEP